MPECLLKISRPSTTYKRLTKLLKKRTNIHVLAIINEIFTFPNMYNYVTFCCKNCKVCVQNKSRRSRRSGELGILGPAIRPYQIMSLDTVGGFGSNRTSSKYLHILVDHFSRYAYISCSKGQSAKEMISLVESVHKCHPISTLLTDQYGSLTSDEFRYSQSVRFNLPQRGMESASISGCTCVNYKFT